MKVDVLAESILLAQQLETMPIFRKQLKIYKKENPFSGKSVIVAHILVPNTLPLIYALIVGGADVTVRDCQPSKIDEEVKLLLEEAEILDLHIQSAENFDYALDTTAFFRNHPPKIGVVEVTRTGVHRWQGVNTRILNVDSTRTKLLETFFGNGKSVLRTLDHFTGDHKKYLEGKMIAVVGFGKIGRGLARLLRDITEVIIMDKSPTVVNHASSLGFSAFLVTNDPFLNSQHLDGVDIVFTATGFEGVMSNYFTEFEGIRINLGAIDEWGDNYSEDQIFHSKFIPFNFNLVPPTENMYIDPILFAHVDALRYLDDLQIGIHPLSKEADIAIMKAFEEYHNFDTSDIEKYFTKEELDFS
ncbi:MAG: hypothetical protein GPJ54_11360 [Candidatus Heimdallarchaeota archaeon]|nr:hypothetical protein [Candidatus Heimdallarchaeota archaeon]